MTEGARLKLRLFGQKWNQHHLSELVTSKLPCTNLCTGTQKGKNEFESGFIELYPKKEQGQSQTYIPENVITFFDGNNSPSGA